MGKIDELIQQYCPDGVEYVQLGEVCEVLTGGEAPDNAIKGKEPIGDCIYPIYSNGIGENALWGYAPTYRISKTSITFSSIGTIGFPTIRECCYTPIIRLKVIYPKDDTVLNVYFLKYVLEIVEFEKQKSSVPNINANMIKSISIPLPPLPVQEAIVNILDRFAVYAAELQADLQAELQATQQQYNYYRDTLLSFEGREDVKEFSVGEIATFTYGYTTKANDEGDIRYIRITDINEQGCLNSSDGKFIYQSPEVEPYLLRKGDLVMARTGATYGKTLYYNEEYPSAYASFLIKISFNDSVNPRYYWHFSKSIKYWEQARRLVGGGAQPQFNTGAISQVKITLPSLAEQQRIVDILDRFDTLVNDLSQGLPAEIEARRQQYEYYRDKLLTFKRK